MDNVADLQASIDELFNRGQGHLITDEQRAALGAQGVRFPENTGPDLGTTAGRRAWMADRYEFEPENDWEKGLYDEQRQIRDGGILPGFLAGGPEYVRRPDPDDPESAGDVYDVGGIFARNVTRAKEYGDALGEFMPFGSETLGAIGSFLAEDLPSSLLDKADSATLRVGSDALGAGYDAVTGGTAGEEWAMDREDFGEFLWQNGSKEAALQAAAAGAAGMYPMSQGANLAARFGGAVGRSLPGRVAAGGAGGYSGMQIAAQGDTNFDQDEARKFLDTDAGALLGLVGVDGVETGVDMRGLGIGLGMLGGPAASVYAPRVAGARQGRIQQRALQNIGRYTNDGQDIAAIAANPQAQAAELMGADASPRLTATAVRRGGTEAGSGGAQLTEGLEARKTGRAERMFDTLSDTMGDDASSTLVGRNQTFLDRNPTGADFEPEVRPMRYGTAVEQSRQYEADVLEAKRNSRERGFRDYKGSVLPNEDMPTRRGEKLDNPRTATTHGAAQELVEMASRRPGFLRNLLARQADQGVSYTVGGNRAIPGSYRKADGTEVDSLFGDGPGTGFRGAISDSEVDALLQQRGILRSGMSKSQRRARLAEARLADAAEEARFIEGLRRLGIVNPEDVAEARAQAVARASARDPLLVQEIKRQYDSAATSAARGTNPDGTLVSDFQRGGSLARRIMARFRTLGEGGAPTGRRVGLVGNRYFQHFETALGRKVSADGSTALKGAYEEGKGAFRNGVQPEDVLRRVEELQETVRRAEVDQRFSDRQRAGAGGRMLPSTRQNIATAAREALHAYRLGALRGYMDVLQSQTMQDARTLAEHNAKVQAKLGAMFDSDAQLDAYLDYLSAERMGKMTENRATRGSMTGENMADDELFGALTDKVAQAGLDLAAGGFSGREMWNTLRQFVGDQWDTMRHGFTREVADEVARQLSRSDLQALADEVAAARRGGRPPNMGNLPAGTQSRVYSTAAQAQGGGHNSGQGGATQAGQPQVAFSRERDPNIPGQEDRISTRYPKTQRATEDAIRDDLQVDTAAMQASPDAFKHNMGLLRSYPGVPPEVRRARNPERIAEVFKDHVKQNLRWLFDQVPEDVRGQTKRWYDGARKISEDWAQEYGIEPRQSAAVLAALSPQKDWFQNVSLAQRTIDIFHKQGKTAADATQMAKAEELFAGKTEIIDAIRGKTLEEVLDEPFAAAAWIRSYDEAFNARGYHQLSPDGAMLGEPSGKAAWGSLVEISKGIRALQDGSADAISGLMGEKHKVRSFYNNIVSPKSASGDVTIDTHAVAAGLLRPLSGNSVEVAHNFGSSLPKNKQPKGYQAMRNVGDSGAAGTYGLYADAYRELAEELGVLPRELQSITWEAVRTLFPAKWKQAKNVAAVDEIWKRFSKGEIDAEAARAEVSALSGGVRTPDWIERPAGGLPAQAGAAGDAGELSGLRVPGRGAEGVDGGAGGPTPGIPAQPKVALSRARDGDPRQRFTGRGERQNAATGAPEATRGPVSNTAVDGLEFTPDGQLKNTNGNLRAVAGLEADGALTDVRSTLRQMADDYRGGKLRSPGQHLRRIDKAIKQLNSLRNRARNSGVMGDKPAMSQNQVTRQSYDRVEQQLGALNDLRRVVDRIGRGVEKKGDRAAFESMISEGPQQAMDRFGSRLTPGVTQTEAAKMAARVGGRGAASNLEVVDNINRRVGRQGEMGHDGARFPDSLTDPDTARGATVTTPHINRTTGERFTTVKIYLAGDRADPWDLMEELGHSVDTFAIFDKPTRDAIGKDARRWYDAELRAGRDHLKGYNTADAAEVEAELFAKYMARADRRNIATPHFSRAQRTVRAMGEMLRAAQGAKRRFGSADEAVAAFQNGELAKEISAAFEEATRLASDPRTAAQAGDAFLRAAKRIAAGSVFGAAVGLPDRDRRPAA